MINQSSSLLLFIFVVLIFSLMNIYVYIRNSYVILDSFGKKNIGFTSHIGNLNCL